MCNQIHELWIKNLYIKPITSSSLTLDKLFQNLMEQITIWEQIWYFYGLH